MRMLSCFLPDVIKNLASHPNDLEGSCCDPVVQQNKQIYLELLKEWGFCISKTIFLDCQSWINADYSLKTELTKGIMKWKNNFIIKQAYSFNGATFKSFSIPKSGDGRQIIVNIDGYINRLQKTHRKNVPYIIIQELAPSKKEWKFCYLDGTSYGGGVTADALGEGRQRGYDSKKGTDKKAKKLADKVMRKLKKSPMFVTTGQIRIDIMIDTKGKLFLLEIESKSADCFPSKNSVDFQRKHEEYYVAMFYQLAVLLDINVLQQQPATRQLRPRRPVSYMHG